MTMAHITSRKTLAISAAIAAVIAVISVSLFNRNTVRDFQPPAQETQASESARSSDIIDTNFDVSASGETQNSDLLFAPADSITIQMIEPWAQSAIVPTIDSYTRHRFVQFDTEEFKRVLTEPQDDSQIVLNFFDETVMTVTITYLNVRNRGSVGARGRTADGRTVWMHINESGQAKFTTNSNGTGIGLITSPLPPAQLVYEFDMEAELAKRGPLVN